MSDETLVKFGYPGEVRLADAGGPQDRQYFYL